MNLICFSSLTLHKVIEVKRLNRRMRRMRVNGETNYIPSRTICLKFAGQILSKYVFLCRNRYEVFPFVSKVKICFACYRIGHISKNYKGKSRCIFCGGDVHDSASTCSKKNDNFFYVNYQGEHLVTSHDCPLIVRHKMILSLAASENIPLIEAKRKIIQSTTAPKDMTYDFNNFPLLNSSKSNNSNINSYHSHNLIFNTLSYNRFSKRPVIMRIYLRVPLLLIRLLMVPTRLINLYFHKRHRSRNKIISCSQKSLQKIDNFNSHYNLLYSPNGRSPHMSNNGVGYNNNIFIEPRNENDNSPPTSCHNQESCCNNNSIVSVSNIDIVSLNNAIVSLSKNIEFICNLARSAYSSPNDALAARFTLSNVNNE